VYAPPACTFLHALHFQMPTAVRFMLYCTGRKTVGHIWSRCPEPLPGVDPSCTGIPGHWHIEEAERLPMVSGTTLKHCAMAGNMPIVLLVLAADAQQQPTLVSIDAASCANTAD
jgi:hypothetical protein